MKMIILIAKDKSNVQKCVIYKNCYAFKRQNKTTKKINAKVVYYEFDYTCITFDNEGITQETNVKERGHGFSLNEIEKPNFLIEVIEKYLEIKDDLEAMNEFDLYQYNLIK